MTYKITNVATAFQLSARFLPLIVERPNGELIVRDVEAAAVLPCDR
jgi:hypothetical protein